MKRTWYRFLALVLCLAMILPTGTAFATPQNHSVSDVTVAEGSGTDDYRFPAVVNAGSKLLAVFRNEADGSICLSESSDNGASWSDPEVIVAGSVGAASPDLSCLSDGTVLLTYNASSGVHLLSSSNAGDTWSAATVLQSSELNKSFSAAASVAELDNGDILIPVYGKGNNTSTASGWHADSVVLRYARTASGWSYVSESVVAREADETALAHVGSGVVYAFTGESGSVYVSDDEGRTWELVAKEEPRVTHAVDSGKMHEEQIQHPAFVKVDDDRWFVTFTNLNTDASKPWETQGKIVYGKMFYPASGWDATISRPLYSADGESRPMGSPVAALTNDGKLLTVYYDSAAKSVLATTSQLSDWPSPAEETGLVVFEEDFADSTLNGNLSGGGTVSYPDGTAYLSPSSDFSGVDHSRTMYLTGKQSFSFDFRFEQDVDVVDGNAVWTRSYNSTSSQTKVTITQDSIAIYNGNGTAACYGYYEGLDTVVAKTQHDTRLSAQKWYTVRIEKENRTFRVKVWPTAENEPEEWALVAADNTSGSSPADKTTGVGFYVRYGTVYKSGAVTRVNQLHMSLDNLKIYKPAVLELNKTYLEVEKGQTGDELQLEAKLWPNADMTSELPAKELTYTSSNPSAVKVEAVSGTNRAKLTFLKRGTATITVTYGNLSAQCKVKVNGALAEKETGVDVIPMYDFSDWSQKSQYLSKSGGATVSGGVLTMQPAAGRDHELTMSSGGKFLTGHFTQQFDFMFDADNTDDGSELRIMPRNSQNGHRIVISPNNLSVTKPTAIDADGGTMVTSVDGFSLEKGVWYTLKLDKEGNDLSVKIWARNDSEPADYDLTVTESAIGHNSAWIIWNYYRAFAANQKVYLDNYVLYRKTAMSMAQATVNGTAGGANKTVSVVFDPDVYSLNPAPGNVTFTSSDPTVVKVDAVSGEPTKASLTFLQKGTATVTATLGSLTASCQVSVKANPADLSNRWEFFKYDFADWSSRPVEKISKSAADIVSDGTLEMEPTTGYSELSLWRDDSPLYITGRYSFQFDFRFNDDNPTGNAVWFRPYYNNSTSLKVNVTQQGVGFYNGSYGTGCTEGYYPGVDTELKKVTFTQPLQAGEWYTVRFEKENDVMRVRVWATDAAEPDTWDAEVTDSATRDYADRKVGFFIRYKSGTAGQTMSLDNLTMFKDVDMTLPEVVTGSLKLPVAELEAEFTPNIFNEKPEPGAVTFTVEDASVATLKPVEGTNKVALSYLKEGTTTIHAAMAGLKAKTQLTVVADDGRSSAIRWEFFDYDFADWGTRPIANITKNGRVNVADGMATMTAAGGTSYANMELWKGDSTLNITGKFSFQFDFRFNADDDANAIWFRPYYNSQSSLKVTVTPDKVAFYTGSYGTGCGMGYYAGDDNGNGGDVLKGEGTFAQPLEDGVWYTVRFERDDANMYVRVWARGETEPTTWNATCTDSLTAGKANDPVGFFVRYNATSGSTANVDNLVMFKEARLVMEETINAGLNLPFMELEAAFVSNIYNEQPEPPAVSFYTTDSQTVAVTPVEGTPNKVVLNFRKTTGSKPVSVIAVMDDYFAKCDITVVNDNGAASANRWDFYEYDFESWSARPTSLSKDGVVTVADGVAHVAPEAGKRNEVVSLYRGSNQLYVTGKFSFQYDFKFDADDASLAADAKNDLWFRPYNSNTCSVKIRVTQDGVGIYKEGQDAAQSGFDTSNTLTYKDTVIADLVNFDQRLAADTWYTVRCEKDGLNFRVKVWPRGEEEPAQWNVVAAHNSVTSDDKTSGIGFYVRYRGAGMSMDNLVLYKYTEMTLAQTTVGGIQNRNPLEVTAKFSPDIYAQLPTPPVVKFYVSDSSVVSIDSVEGTSNGNKASLGFSRTTTDADDITLTAIMEGFFATSKVKVMDIVAEPTTEIGDRLELFVDDSLIDLTDEIDGVSSNVTIVLHEPQAAEESENPFPRAYYTTVIWDEEAGLYRGYYRADGAWGQCYCYVESTDGINWYKPALGLYPRYVEQYDLHNVIIAKGMPGNKGGFEHNFTPFLDTNPNCDPNERFKAIAGYGGDLGELEDGEVVGLYTLVSPDGIHWSVKSPEPVLVFDAAKHYWAFDSSNNAFWCEEEGKYVMFYRHYNVGLGVNNTCRSVGRATSEDFITWVDELETFKPLNLENGKEEIYASQTAPYYRAPHIYIGTATRYALGNVIGIDPDTGKQYTYEEAVRDNQGATDLMLISSRAGSDHFDRYFDEAFLRPGLGVTGWTDRYNYTSLNIVPTGYGEISFYHYDGTRYTLRTDGFASVRAGAEGGELVTKPVSFTGSQLLLNYSASVMGSIVVELTDEYGKVYPGFEAENCEPLTGDHIEKAVKWKNASVSSLIGKSVKIRFIMKEVDLYSYKFGQPEDDVVRIEAAFNQTEPVYALGRFEQLEPMLTVTAVYRDGSRKVLTPDAYSLRGALAVTTGNRPAVQEITVYYGDLTATFSVTCYPVEAVAIEAAFTSDEITSDMSLRELAQLLDVKAINNDGSVSPIVPGVYTIECRRIAINSTVTVTYGALQTTVRIPAVVTKPSTVVPTLPTLESTYVASTGTYENISNRLELFVDDALVDQLVGEAQLIMHEPQKAADSENPFPRGSYTTVIYDEKDGIYRGYYRADGFWGQRICYVESPDGINWYKPVLDVYPNDASGLTNVIISPETPGNKAKFEHNFSPFLDTNPNCNPNERYKAIAGYGGDLGKLPDGEVVGLYTLVSPDGIHWSVKSDEPFLAFDKTKHSWAFDSQNVGFWSEAEQLYVCYYRHYKYSATATSTRTVGRATSPDFINWTDEAESFQTPNLSKDEQLYTSQTAPYFRAPHIYIATPTRYALGNLAGYDPETATAKNLGATDVMFMTSRAGDNAFTRLFEEAFLNPGLDKANWTDRWNYMSLNFVPTGGTEMSFYHKSGDRYTLRTDGFVSVNAGAAGGEVITEPVIFSGSELVVNYSTSVKGSLAVELQDASGNPYPGFEAANCIVLSGDSIEQIVSWKNASVKSLIGKPVKVRFILKDCDLYSYRFANVPKLRSVTALFEQTEPVYALGTFESLKPMLKVVARYTDGTARVLMPDEYSVRGPLAVGTQTITVYYQDKTSKFTVDVLAVQSQKLHAQILSSTIDPNASEDQLKANLKVTMINNDGSMVEVHPEAYTLEISASADRVRLTVSYDGLSAVAVGEPVEGFDPRPNLPEAPEYPDEPEDPVQPDAPEDPFGPGTSDDPVKPSVSFIDVPGTAWYHEAVEYVVLNGLMSGMSETEFGPSYTLNRAMVVTVLWRMEGEPKVNSTMTFTDVPAGQWYTEAVRWAAAQGIVNGIDAQTYAPLNAVTREQLVTILWRYAQKKGYDVSVGEDTNILSYADAFSISDYAVPAMQWACGAGVMSGSDDGRLNPKNQTKRSEFAKVIMNFCENVAE